MYMVRHGTQLNLTSAAYCSLMFTRIVKTYFELLHAFSREPTCSTKMVKKYQTP